MWIINEHSAKENFKRLINFTIANKLIKDINGDYYRPIEKVSKKNNIQLFGEYITKIEYSKEYDEVVFYYGLKYIPSYIFFENDLMRVFNKLIKGLMENDKSYSLYFSFGQEEENKNKEYIITHCIYDKVTEDIKSSYVGRFKTKKDAETAIWLYPLYKKVENENKYIIDLERFKLCLTIQEIDKEYSNE